MALQIEGYTIFLVKCADGSYYSGMCLDMKKRLFDINNRFESYFKNKSELLPVKVVFREDHVQFREAYIKHNYLRSLTKRARDRLVQTGRWPISKVLKDYIGKNESISLH